jgi:hypothetical protein
LTDLAAFLADFFADDLDAPAFFADAPFFADAFATAFLIGPLLFKADLKAEAGANRTLFDAAIFTGAPVCGFRPVRAARDVGVKVPNPKIDTLSPDLVSVITESMKATTAPSALRLSSPALSATESTSSDLFTATSWLSGKLLAMKEVFGVKVKHFR